MPILYSKVPPMPMDNSQLEISSSIVNMAQQASRIDIAVGYVSVDGLEKLDQIVSNGRVKQVNLIIGMYWVSGIPESIYNKVRTLQAKWKRAGKGAIFLVRGLSYHGKVYVFSESKSAGRSHAVQAVVGSANLSVMAPMGSVARQYELATTIEDSDRLGEFVKHVKDLRDKCSVSADRLDLFNVVHERIEVLGGIEEIYETTPSEMDMYKSLESETEIRIPIKAPLYAKRFSTKKIDCARSNINVAYGKGRTNSESGATDARNWYEVQITVSKSISSLSEYPKGKPFWIVTDDGYKFEAHTTADYNKQLTAYCKSGNDRVFGRWIKGRLATAGYVKPVDDTFADTNREGVVTQEMLDAAKMRTMVLTKTNTQEYGRVFKRLPPTPKNKKGALDKKHWDRELLDVWTVRFEGEAE